MDSMDFRDAAPPNLLTYASGRAILVKCIRNAFPLFTGLLLRTWKKRGLIGKSINKCILYGKYYIWGSPCENLDRDGSTGMGCPKNIENSTCYKRNRRKSLFFKICNAFRSCESPSSHRNPFREIGFISNFLYLGPTPPNLLPRIETSRKFPPTPKTQVH